MPLVIEQGILRWKPLSIPLTEGMPNNCWVRQVAKKAKGKRGYWIDNSNNKVLYTWDYFHETQESTHVEIWKIIGTKFAYLVEEADPFDSSRKWEVPKRKQGRKIEV